MPDFITLLPWLLFALCYVECGWQIFMNVHYASVIRGDMDVDDWNLIAIIRGAGDRRDRGEVAACYVLAATFILAWPVFLVIGWLGAKRGGSIR